MQTSSLSQRYTTGWKKWFACEDTLGEASYLDPKRVFRVSDGSGGELYVLVLLRF